MKNLRNFYSAVILACGLTLGLTTSAALADPPDRYVGGGIRFGIGDETGAVIHGKFEVLDFGALSLSGRPALIIGDTAEVRLAATGETEIAPRLSPYLGGGISINTDGSGDVDPLLTTGLDIKVLQQVVVQVGGNLIFSDDTDAEVTATVNFAF